jgi:hypothetical protein
MKDHEYPQRHRQRDVQVLSRWSARRGVRGKYAPWLAATGRPRKQFAVVTRLRSHG